MDSKAISVKIEHLNDDANEKVYSETSNDLNNHNILDTSIVKSEDNACDNKVQKESEDDDVPEDFFDDFSNQDFMAGLDVVDTWVDDKSSQENECSASKKNMDSQENNENPKSINRDQQLSRADKSKDRNKRRSRSADKVKDKPRQRSRPKSADRFKPRYKADPIRKRSRSKEVLKDDIERRDPAKTKRDIQRDKLRFAKDQEAKYVAEKLKVVETGLVPPGMEMESDISVKLENENTVKEENRASFRESKGDEKKGFLREKEKYFVQRPRRRSRSRSPAHPLPMRPSRSPARYVIRRSKSPVRVDYYRERRRSREPLEFVRRARSPEFATELRRRRRSPPQLFSADLRHRREKKMRRSHSRSPITKSRYSRSPLKGGHSPASNASDREIWLRGGGGGRPSKRSKSPASASPEKGSKSRRFGRDDFLKEIHEKLNPTTKPPLKPAAQQNAALLPLMALHTQQQQHAQVSHMQPMPPQYNMNPVPMPVPAPEYYPPQMVPAPVAHQQFIQNELQYHHHHANQYMLSPNLDPANAQHSAQQSQFVAASQQPMQMHFAPAPGIQPVPAPAAASSTSQQHMAPVPQNIPQLRHPHLDIMGNPIVMNPIAQPAQLHQQQQHQPQPPPPQVQHQHNLHQINFLPKILQHPPHPASATTSSNVMQTHVSAAGAALPAHSTNKEEDKQLLSKLLEDKKISLSDVLSVAAKPTDSTLLSGKRPDIHTKIKVITQCQESIKILKGESSISSRFYPKKCLPNATEKTSSAPAPSKYSSPLRGKTITRFSFTTIHSAKMSDAGAAAASQSDFMRTMDKLLASLGLRPSVDTVEAPPAPSPSALDPAQDFSVCQADKKEHYSILKNKHMTTQTEPVKCAACEARKAKTCATVAVQSDDKTTYDVSTQITEEDEKLFMQGGQQSSTARGILKTAPVIQSFSHLTPAQLLAQLKDEDGGGGGSKSNVQNAKRQDSNMMMFESPAKNSSPDRSVGSRSSASHMDDHMRAGPDSVSDNRFSARNATNYSAKPRNISSRMEEYMNRNRFPNSSAMDSPGFRDNNSGGGGRYNDMEQQQQQQRAPSQRDCREELMEMRRQRSFIEDELIGNVDSREEMMMMMARRDEMMGPGDSWDNRMGDRNDMLAAMNRGRNFGPGDNFNDCEPGMMGGGNMGRNSDPDMYGPAVGNSFGGNNMRGNGPPMGPGDWDGPNYPDRADFIDDDRFQGYGGMRGGRRGGRGRW